MLTGWKTNIGRTSVSVPKSGINLKKLAVVFLR